MPFFNRLSPQYKLTSQLAECLLQIYRYLKLPINVKYKVKHLPGIDGSQLIVAPDWPGREAGPSTAGRKSEETFIANCDIFA